MQEYIARANIANFRKQLLDCQGDVGRKGVLTTLLRAEQRRLTDILAGDAERR
jgi:hypothetical protein